MKELQQNSSNIMKPWRNRKICSHHDFAILNCICTFNVAYEARLNFQKDKKGKIENCPWIKVENSKLLSILWEANLARLAKLIIFSLYIL